MQIQDNVFIITGGASGLGAATARMLTAAGGKVVLADVQTEAGQALAAELNGVFVQCDVTSEEDGMAVVAAAGKLGTLRGLADLAIVGRHGRRVDDDAALAFSRRILFRHGIGRQAAHIEGAHQVDVDDFLEQGQRMRAILAHGFHGRRHAGAVDQAAYASSKAAVVGLTLPMARDLSRNGIRVMTVAPGIFETPMLLGMPAEVQDALGKMVPFPSRLGKPGEYAQLVKAIVENVMLNGETIRLDGAIRMQPK